MKDTHIKTRGATKCHASSIEPPKEEENNNNENKDMSLFIDYAQKFSEIEIKFILLHINKNNMMGRKINKTELLDIEKDFVLKVVSRAEVADFGSLLKNIIQIKLLNSI